MDKGIKPGVDQFPMKWIAGGRRCVENVQLLITGKKINVGIIEWRNVELLTLAD